MTEQDMLELAAKAAGYQVLSFQHGKANCKVIGESKNFHWNPLTDDGDAFRLAVKLKLELSVFDDYVFVFTPYEESIEVSYTDDPAKALRYAITKAACGMCEA